MSASRKTGRTETLLQRARRAGTPLIEGESATFVWRGSRPPGLIGDFNDFDEDRPVELGESAPGVWSATLTLPREAYVEYAFVRRGTRVPDPLNRRTSPDGFGNRNHYFYMPGARPAPLARRRPHVPAGRVTRHRVETDGYAAGDTREVHLYRPPTGGPWPLVVVFDGSEYLRRARLPAIVDNLIAQNHIRPLALALVAGGGRNRLVEYGCNDATVAFVLDSVLPLARAKLDLMDPDAAPGSYGVVGASLGGVSALYLALRAPAIFGHVLSQSGAFSYHGHDHVIFDLVRYLPVAPLRVWLDAGVFENLRPGNERLRELLTARGYPVHYREFPGGHNFVAWRNDVGRGLEWLFGA
jgi:enterochelin esterase family protein